MLNRISGKSHKIKCLIKIFSLIRAVFVPKNIHLSKKLQNLITTKNDQLIVAGVLLLLLLLVLKPSDDAIDKYLIKKLKLGDDFRTQTKNIPDKHRSIEASQSFNPI